MGIEQGWSQIKLKAIDVLLEQLARGFDQGAKPFDNKDYMEVYTICYNLCTQRAPHNFSEKLYEYHGSTMTQYLGENALPALQSRHGEFLLEELIKRWKHHKIMNRWMKRFFTYLDRYYVKHHSHESLHRVGVDSFKTEVYMHIKENVVQAMLASIEKERNGEEVDHQQLKSCVAVFETMGLGDMDCYINDLEDALLTFSETHYTAKAATWMSTDDTPAYLIKAEAALKSESQRVKNYLIGSTEPKLSSVCEKQLLEVHQTELLERENSGCAALLKNNKVDDLTRMFQLFGRLDEGLVPMAKLVEEYFMACGKDLMDERKQAIDTALAESKKESASDPTLVQSLIDLHERCQSFGEYLRRIIDGGRRPSLCVCVCVCVCALLLCCFVVFLFFNLTQPFSHFFISPFPRNPPQFPSPHTPIPPHTPVQNKFLVDNQFQKDPLFQSALKAAFELIMNNDVGSLSNAEYLASFCDRILKKGGEKLSDSQVETKLDNIVQLFSYLNDKDLFSDIYRNLLSKRLLNQKSANDDAEKSMIGKLKLKCGAQFTSKMEGMINDLTTGKDHLEKFQIFAKENEKKFNLMSVDFTVQVLTTGFWPKNVETKLQLPTCMTNCVSAFSEYYDKATDARKLLFVESLGSCTVQMKCEKKVYDLSVTTLQAAVLDMFSMKEDGTRPEYSLEEIVAQLTLEEKFTKKVLHSLSCGKYKVLQKTPKGKKISTGDRFKAAIKFSNNSRKLRIPMASLQPSHDSKRVEDDRTVAIEASIVRIMKTRKQLRHTDLIGEVLKQLQFFRPQPKSVKRCIERLIDREYLERDENESSMYRYLA